MSKEVQPESLLKWESPSKDESRATDITILKEHEQKALYEANDSKSIPSPEHPKVRRLKEVGFEVDTGNSKTYKGQIVENHRLSPEDISENGKNNHTNIHIPDAHQKQDEHGNITHFDILAKPQAK